MLRLVVLIFLVVLEVRGRIIVQWKDVTNDSSARKEAEEHFMRIESKVCSTPVAKLFPVVEYNDENQIYDGFYKPHCVELFRCNNDAGCCQDETMECKPMAEEVVYLYVSVVRPDTDPMVLQMPFLNHTRCECRSASGNWVYPDLR